MSAINPIQPFKNTTMLKADHWQSQIYIKGFAGKTNSISPDFDKLEAQAIQKMDPKAAGYIVGGAGRQETVANNRSGFAPFKIVPRMLRNVEQSDTSTNLFGQNFASPFWLCPIGVLEMVHPEADLAVARAAAEAGIPYVFSNQSSVPMETCANAMGTAPHFFQLYWSKNRDLVASFVQRAEACGCAGIVLTLGSPWLGWWPIIPPMRCIVTAGPTVEPLDAVRRLTNHSTGTLGTQLANHLAGCGHDVLLLRSRTATAAPHCTQSAPSDSEPPTNS